MKQNGMWKWHCFDNQIKKKKTVQLLRNKN